MIKEYYIQTVQYSSALAFGCNIIYLISDSLFSIHKSEWMTTESLFPILLLMVLVNAVIFAVLCLPVLLNHYKQIANSPALSTLSWFVFPAAWIVFLFIAMSPDAFDYSDGWDSSGIFVVLNTVPYIIGLMLSYRQFRRALKSQI